MTLELRPGVKAKVETSKWQRKVYTMMGPPGWLLGIGRVDQVPDGLPPFAAPLINHVLSGKSESYIV